MLRVARWLLFLGTACVVFGLGWFHARYIGMYDYEDSYRFSWSAAYVLMLAVAAYGMGLPDLPRNAYQVLWAAAAGAVLGGVGISMAQLVLGSQLLPRFVVFWAAIAVLPLWSTSSVIAARHRRRQRERDRLLVVATEEETERLAIDLRHRPERSATVADVLKPEEAAEPGRIGHAVTAARASVVVLSREAMNDDGVIDQVAGLHEAGVRVRSLTLFYDEWLGKLPLSELERVALMFDIGEIHRARYGRLKRAMDLTVALLGAPVFVVSMPLVALLNAFGNRGPLFYRQKRVGRGDREFTIWKYRTMRDNGSLHTDWTTENDPRVTPGGRLMRKSHLDELPQVINLLRGEVSTVGPRPEQPQYVSLLSEKIRFYRLRHLVRPGITGWAQVKYDYGSTDMDAMEKLQYEFWYLRHQSLTLELRILGRTLRRVLGGKGR